MNKIQVVETFLSRVIHECESVASLQKWLSENCYCIYGKNLYLKANDERVFVRYNGAEPSANVQNNKMTVRSLINKFERSTFVIISTFHKGDVYYGLVDSIGYNYDFLNYYVQRIESKGGIICINCSIYAGKPE